MYRRDVYAPVGGGFPPVPPPPPMPHIPRRRIPVKDKFKLIYNFSSKADPAYRVPFDDFDIRMRYFIKGREEEYLVIKEGTKIVNCILVYETSTLKAIFENHGLGTGDLWVETTYKMKDFEFSDGLGEITRVSDTGITLIY